MSLLSIAFYAVLLIATGIYIFFKKQFSFFEKQGVPHEKPSIPFGNMNGVGSSVSIVEKVRDMFQDLKRKGKVVGFYNLTDPVYLITDIEIIKHITVKDFNTFVNRGVFVNEENEPLTGHLFALEDEKWRFLRNKLSPVFTSGKLKNMFLTISSLGKDFVDAVEKRSKSGKSIDTKDVANRFTVDIISSVAFGMKSSTLKDEHPELINIFREIFGAEGPSLLYFFFLFAFPNLSKKLKLRQFSKNISDFFMNVVAGNIKYREDNNERRSDFLDMLIQLKNKGSIDGEFSTETKKLTLNECLAQAFIFFFAGADTSSTTLSFALAEVAFNLDVQEKLRNEIKEKTKDTNGEISYDLLHEMTYLNQVVSEVLRTHGPVFAAIRKANEDYIVPDSDLIIKKGRTVWIPMEGFHYDDRYWENPRKFDPERFTQEEIAKRPPLSYSPFGEGPRNCIGMRLGLLNVKFGLATIIQHFKVTPDAKMDYPIKLNPKATTLEPLGGFMLKYEKI